MGNNALNYKIPEQSPRKKDSRDLRPKTVENWLGNLPRANIGVMAKQLYELLTQSNRLKLEPIHRLQLLQPLYEPINYLLEAMEKHYIGSSLPLPAKNQKIALLTQSLLHEIILAHKCIILDSISGHKTRISRLQLATIMHNHLAFNNRLLMCLNLTYSTIPNAFWREQCLILQYAEQHGISELAVFGGNSPWSVLNRFKQAVLLTLTAPHSLAQNEIQQLNNHLVEWVSNCRLLSMKKYTPGLHSQFINLNGDTGPQHIDNPTNYDSGWRIIDTSTITPILENEINQVRYQLNAIELHEETLQRICKQLGNGQKRQFNRTTRSGSFTLAIGSSAIHWMLSHHIGFGNRDVERPASYQSSAVTNAGSNDAPDVWNVYRDASTTVELTDDISNKPIKYKTYDFNVVDESANGFKLHLRQNQEASGLKVGELVSLHKGFNGTGQQCGIALIRWLHRTTKNELMIGIELIAPSATPVEVSLQQEGNATESPHKMRALLLPALPAIKQPSTLIVPSTFKVNQQVILHLEDESKLVSLSQLRNQGGSHGQFEFKNKQSTASQDPKEKLETIESNDDNLDNAWQLL